MRGAVDVGVGVGGAGRLRLLRVDSLRVGGARPRSSPSVRSHLVHIGAIGGNPQGRLVLNVLGNLRVTLDFQGGSEGD